MAEASWNHGEQHHTPTSRKARGVVSTPARLRRLSVLIAVFGTCLTVIGAGGLAAAEVTVTVIQQRIVPSVLGVQYVHAWLADADRSAANAYLAGGAEITLPQLQYEADIAAASRELEVASEHNPGGSDTTQRLQAIMTLVDQYVGLVQTASVDDRLGVPAGTVYLQAGSSLMHRPGGILAQVDALRDIYAAAFTAADRSLGIMVWLSGVYAVVGTTMLAVLLITQRFIRRRFRRRWNPRLVGATLLLVVVSSLGAVGALRSAQTVGAADRHVYGRLLQLWEARSLVYDANGAESLSLIAQQSPGGTGATDQTFAGETGHLVDRQLSDETLRRAANGQVDFNGLLADELRGADTTAERDAAIHTLVAYRSFISADAAMRSSASEGDHAKALTLALGTDQGQLIFAFDDLDWYLGVTIQDLQSQFDATMGASEFLLGVSAAIQLLSACSIWLALRGIRPRLNEYRIGGS